MPLVQMTNLRLDPERAQQPPSADPEQHLLLEAQLRAAAIELARDSSMRGEIRGVIAVQQIKLHPAHLHLPGAQPDGISGQRDLQTQPLSVGLAQRLDRQLSGIVIREKGLLRSVFIDHLPKIALLVEQSNAHHRHTQVAGGFQLIAGHIPEPARVDGQSFTQHEFHAEIGNARQRTVRVILLKPGRRLRRPPSVIDQAIDLFPENGIRQHALDLVARHRFEDHPGVLRDRPQLRVKLPPHLVGRVVPRPAHIQRQFFQRFGLHTLRTGICDSWTIQ